MKVLGTNTSLPYETHQKIKELSDKELRHNQFRIVCRCKGMVDGKEIDLKVTWDKNGAYVLNGD